MVTKSLTSKKRMDLALHHKEPDRVPFDLAGTLDSGISVDAYKNLLVYLGIKRNNIPPVIHIMQQLAGVSEEVLEKLKVDTRGLIPNPPSAWKLDIKDKGDYTYYVDEWGIGWKMPKKGGYYYDIFQHPLKGQINKESIDRYLWLDPIDPFRVEGLNQKAQEFKAKEKAIIMSPIGGGFFEFSFWVRGFEEFYMDLAANPSLACYLMDKLLEIRIAYWDMVLEKLGKYIQVVMEADDLGTQARTIISPSMYRKYIKPRQKKLFSHIKTKAPHIFIFYHTCGSVYDIIPDLIETGIDILNPIQVSAAKMDTRLLKKYFGKDLTFWGGGIDTQRVLPYGSPQQVKDEVKRRMDDLAPGGGFVFTPVHNIQADVPPENIMAMWEALQEYGKY